MSFSKNQRNSVQSFKITLIKLNNQVAYYNFRLNSTVLYYSVLHSSNPFPQCHTLLKIRTTRLYSNGLLANLSQRLIGELIVYPWSSVRHRPSSTMLKHLLLRNRLADQSQILCGASLGRGGGDIAVSGLLDQDGRYAHIW